MKQIQEGTETFRHTGQRKNLFTNCLEYHCLLVDLVFILCFQRYLIFFCFPAKPSVINWQGFGVLTFKVGAVSTKLRPT